MPPSETRNVAVAQASSNQTEQSAAPPPIIFEPQIERLLTLAEMVLAGKRRGEGSQATAKDSEAKKAKGAPEPDERSGTPALFVVRGDTGAGKTTVLERVAAGLNVKSFFLRCHEAVSYTHLRAHEPVLDIVCRLLLEKKKNTLTKCYRK